MKIEGLRTTLWKHQVEAYRFQETRPSAMLAMEMACVAGSTQVTINRGGNARRYTIEQVYDRVTNQKWDPSIPTMVRCLTGERFGLNRLGGVFSTGAKAVLRLTLSSGKSIRLTHDHRVLTPHGWIEAGRLLQGFEVLTNGVVSCPDCGYTRKVQQPMTRLRLTEGRCGPCANKSRKRAEKVIDKAGYVRVYNMHGHPRANPAGQAYEHHLVMEAHIGRFLTKEERVHHKNGIRHDNRIENLELFASNSEHLKAHHSEHYFNLDSDNVVITPRVDTVKSIEEDGEAEVYDLAMASPYHNFVANGIVVHNCGKSLVAIAEAVQRPTTLVLCPARVVGVWPEQFRRHVERDMVVAALTDKLGTVADRVKYAQQKLELARSKNVPLVAIINYEAAWRDEFARWACSERGLPRTWGLVVCDESHKIKDPKGAAAKFAAKLRAHKRLALTGTPMPHSPLDIWAQYRFLDPSIFGDSFYLFKCRYSVLGGYMGKQVQGFQDLDILHQKMYRIAFRVGKEVLDLPEEMDLRYECEMSPEGARVYKGLEKDFIAGVESGVVTAANAMVKLLKLQQATGGYLRTDVVKDDQGNMDGGKVVQVDQSKAQLLEEILSNMGEKEPVIVFCRFHTDLDTVHRAAKNLGRESLELSGRRDQLAEWQQEGAAPILAVQEQAGGMGVDCTRARYAIYFSLSWSNGDYRQAKARIHRPGQKHPVAHIHLVVKGSIDESVLAALEKREDVVSHVLDVMRKERVSGSSNGNAGSAIAA